MIAARQNREAATGGAVELTERELELPPMFGDSTAVYLELKWNVVPDDADGEGLPEWLTVAKLSELGFDCHVPVDGPDAMEHYASLPAAAAYVALELEGEAWKRSQADRSGGTRLFAVDAGRDGLRLREKYPDPHRHVIVRGVVKPRLQDRSTRDGKPLAQPRLRGRITMILPGEIFVPPPYSASLQDLRRPESAWEGGPPVARFAVQVSWGRRYEPWVDGLRMLPAQMEQGQDPPPSEK
jgi:hypothetical protein